MNKNRGQSEYLVSKIVSSNERINGAQLIAAAWWDKHRKNIIATCGTNGNGPPHGRIRYNLTEEGITQRTHRFTDINRIMYEYFSFAQKINVHNHYRQGNLAMERVIHTNNFCNDFS